MLDSPPPVIALAPEVPVEFSISEGPPPHPFRLQQDCGSSGKEIVICGQRRGNRYRLVAPPEPNPAWTNAWPQGLELRLGPLTIGSGTVEGTRGTGAGITIKLHF